jgi:hypothetical protein
LGGSLSLAFQSSPVPPPPFADDDAVAVLTTLPLSRAITANDLADVRMRDDDALQQESYHHTVANKNNNKYAMTNHRVRTTHIFARWKIRREP